MFSLTVTEMWKVLRVRTQIDLSDPDHLKRTQKYLMYEAKDLRANK